MTVALSATKFCLCQAGLGVGDFGDAGSRQFAVKGGPSTVRVLFGSRGEQFFVAYSALVTAFLKEAIIFVFME